MSIKIMMKGDTNEARKNYIQNKWVINSKSMSKNQLEERSNLQRTQLNSYANNKVKRIDLDVLARLCGALDVDVEDILEYKKIK